MRTYRKLFINETLDQVSARDVYANGTLIALEVPSTKAQIISAFNRLGAFYVPSGTFGAAVWKLYDGNGNLFTTFSGPQLANDVFSFVAYDHHPEN